MRGTYVQVCACANLQGIARLGIVAGKRQLRTAVLRNFAKRQIRETFRLHQNDIPLKDFVVRVMRPVHAGDVSAIRSELLMLLQRAKRCRD